MKRCLLLLVALATMPSTFALPPGEFSLASRPIGFAPFDRRNVKVAANDTLALVVWEDFRTDPDQPARVWASRIRRSSGEVLDSTGISIAPLSSEEESHLRAVSTDGTDFLVAWNDGDRIKFARVLASGEVVPVPDFDLLGQQVSITFLGDLYAVFFTAKESGQFLDVHLALLDKTGRQVRRLGAAVRSSGVRALASAVSHDGAFLNVAWSDIADGAVHNASFLVSQLRAGVLVPATPVAGGGFGTAPSLMAMTTNGTDIFIAWNDEGSHAYRFRRFTGDGVPIGAAVTIESSPAISPALDAVWNGAQYVVAFRSTNGLLQAVRYDSDGTRLDSTPLQLTPSVITDVALAFSPGLSDVVVAWVSELSSGAVINADFLTSSDVLRFAPAHRTLSNSLANRSDAVAVWRGDHYLAAWTDTLDFPRAVIGRFTVDGQRLDGSGITLGSSVILGPPSLASNGRTAMVAWLDGTGVAAVFVDEAGQVSRRLSGFAGGVPTVHWNGQQYLVVWRSNQGQLLGMRLNGAGVYIDPQPVAIVSGSTMEQPLVGWTGNSYVIAQPEVVSCPVCPLLMTISAQIVSPSLTAIGSAIPIADTSTALPSVADGAGGALIVWPRLDGTLRGVRVFNGAVLDQFNGFLIGNGNHASVYGSAAGWGVVSGPFLWLVSRNGTVAPRLQQFPFVPVGAHASVVLGGPEPLVVYRRNPVAGEQMMQVVAHYAFTPSRSRAAKH